MGRQGARNNFAPQAGNGSKDSKCESVSMVLYFPDLGDTHGYV
jgi:hypothetical protein